MQNVDFSRMINRKAPERAPRQEDPRFDRNYSPNINTTADIKRSNRAYVLAVAVALIAFTAGILAGMQLADFRSLEDKIVKYPEGRKSAAPASTGSSPTPGANVDGGLVSLSNTAPSAATGTPSGMGKYLIKIGTFPPEDAERLVSQLNHVRELDPVRPLNCKHVKQTVPRRKLAFTIPLNEEIPRKNVFVGCFSDRGQAGSVVNILTSSGLPGTSQAKLYEIE